MRSRSKNGAQIVHEGLADNDGGTRTETELRVAVVSWGVGVRRRREGGCGRRR